ncbi:MAG: STAS domain-containing protein [Acidobacteriota bacterium]|nr:STAS domain-containing protein [Acidobacteriota bacterium]MDH3529822.1 STAS domain-containing protein [Acidobacteriota bacterium]
MADLNISKRKAGDTVILDLTGDVVFGESNTTLRSAIRSQIREGHPKLSLNMQGVEYLDSSGIGELISALTAVNREEGGQLRILNPTDRIMQLFAISKLTEIFDIDYEAG